MRLLTLVVVALFAFCPFSEALAQSGVEAQVDLESVVDPLDTEQEDVKFEVSTKSQTYTPLLVIPGFAVMDYDKDLDPYGEFQLTVTAFGAGPIKVQYAVGHEIIDVSTGSWTMQTTLSVELIDLDGDSNVFLRSISETEVPGLLVPFVVEDTPVFDERVVQTDLIHGVLENITSEGTTNYDSGLFNYTGSEETLAMGVGGIFELSEGDRVILTGRFEIAAGQVPVEPTTWGRIKALYGE